MSNDDKSKKDIDELSGVETTGHEWDGLKELNNPAPRWWLWIFYVCIIWSVGYWILYPAWPTLSGATKGALGWTQYTKLEAEQAEIKVRQEAYLDRFEDASFEKIMGDKELYAFAVAGGKAAFKDNCATCHGTGGEGAIGYPNLNDDDWLWGGTIDDIYQTVQYGIRSGHSQARTSVMPAFGELGMMNAQDISFVTEHVLSLSGETQDNEKGAELFKMQCAACHGEEGKGNRMFGAPDLSDAIWLYGGDHESIYKTIFSAQAGMMPSWKARLDKNTLRQLAVYVHQLGGGE